jgi:5-(carboxyamino)imidazole ribonucleotide mutase
MSNSNNPLVGLIMGSTSDWETLEATAITLTNLGVPFETKVVSAHRTPKLLFSYATEAADQGLKVIIAGAGGAAHLPGMVASMTHLPVIGIPVESKALHGMDSLLSIAQMPAGIPVATVAIGKAGATNAAILAASILGISDDKISHALKAFRAKQTEDVMSAPSPKISSAKQDSEAAKG